eukprot:gene11838-biopygen3004
MAVDPGLLAKRFATYETTAKAYNHQRQVALARRLANCGGLLGRVCYNKECVLWRIDPGCVSRRASSARRSNSRASSSPAPPPPAYADRRGWGGAALWRVQWQRKLLTLFTLCLVALRT